MRIIISSKAEKGLRRLSKLDQIAIVRKIRLIKEGGLGNEESLKGYKNIYRIRVGHNRVVYKRTKEEIYIVLIAHRKDIYRMSGRILG